MPITDKGLTHVQVYKQVGCGEKREHWLMIKSGQITKERKRVNYYPNDAGRIMKLKSSSVINFDCNKREICRAAVISNTD